jgi:hypothetical protein
MIPRSLVAINEARGRTRGYALCYTDHMTEIVPAGRGRLFTGEQPPSPEAERELMSRYGMEPA